MPDAMKERLRAVAVTLDPLRLLDEIRGVQHLLARLAAGETIHVAPRSEADLDQFLKSLATAWHVGEVRPTHAKLPRPERHWRTQKDPFEAVWPRIVTWLSAEPDATAIEILERLHNEQPGVYPDALVRTLQRRQRRLKECKAASARRLVFAPGELADPHAVQARVG